MALYQVEITVRLETYAHTEDEAIRTVERAIRADSTLAGPQPRVPMFGGAVATINPDRTRQEHVMDMDDVRLDMLDIPTAWKLQKIGGIEHDPRCSSQPDAMPGMSGPHFLCDCGAVERAWQARRAGAGLPPG